MRKTILSTTIVISLLSACQNYETYHPPYEFRISENNITAIEDGRIFYQDYKPFGSLDGLGIINFGGRAMGYSGSFIADTNNQFFKNAAKKYRNKIFPLLPEEKIPK